jgi:hypothetical protein
MQDNKRVEQGVIQFNLSGYSDPICSEQKTDQTFIVKARGEDDLLFQCCCCPGAVATGNVSEESKCFSATKDTTSRTA